MKTVKKMSNFVIKKISYCLLSVLNFIIPKSEKTVFIFDKKFRKDNVWAIARYLSSTKGYEEYKIYYYTKKRKKDEKNIRYINNGLFALWFQLRAKYIFYSYSEGRQLKATRNQFIINTMHGSPLKRIGYLASKSRFKWLWNYKNQFTHVLCNSDFFKDIVKNVYGTDESQCVVLGYPRNDLIFEKNDLLKEFGINKVFSKIVLWMPTWRRRNAGGGNSESKIDFPILNAENINYLNKILRKMNTLIIIKTHPIQADLEIFNEAFSNIKILRNKDFEDKDIYIYEIFNEVDALLTDYSSVFFDFLLTMKPIGFTVDDYDIYGEKRGFTVENPLELMPGEKITNITELIVFLDDLKNGRDKFYLARKKVNELANKYKDGKSTERLVEFLGM